MTQSEFLASLTPDQTAAFIAIRDAIQQANADQNTELAVAFQKERDTHTAVATQLATAKSNLTSALALGAQVRALYEAKNFDALDAFIAHQKKTLAQVRADELTKEIEDRQAELDALEK